MTTAAPSQHFSHFPLRDACTQLHLTPARYDKVRAHMEERRLRQTWIERADKRFRVLFILGGLALNCAIFAWIGHALWGAWGLAALLLPFLAIAVALGSPKFDAPGALGLFNLLGWIAGQWWIFSVSPSAEPKEQRWIDLPFSVDPRDVREPHGDLSRDSVRIFLRCPDAQFCIKQLMKEDKVLEKMLVVKLGREEYYFSNAVDLT